MDPINPTNAEQKILQNGETTTTPGGETVTVGELPKADAAADAKADAPPQLWLHQTDPKIHGHTSPWQPVG